MNTNKLDEQPTRPVEAPGTDREVTITGPSESVLASHLVSRLRAAGHEFRLRGNRLAVSPWKSLTDEDRAAIRAHRHAIKEIVRRGLPPTQTREPQPAAPVDPPPTQPEPQPVYFAWPGRVITEADVIEALECLGDEAVADYRTGRLTRLDAYFIAQHRLREQRQLRHRSSAIRRVI